VSPDGRTRRQLPLDRQKMTKKLAAMSDILIRAGL
jgi:hypothetical protein